MVESGQKINSSSLCAMAVKHINDILSHAIMHDASRQALIVFDEQSPLAELLAAAYRQVLPQAQCLNFDKVTPETIIETFNTLSPGDLVVLIQSTSFRLNAFRIRVELFNQSLKVIEHPHLSRMQGEEMQTYVESLAYSPDYYRKVGASLADKIANAPFAWIDSEGEILRFDSPFESPKLNVGDYRNMKNVGGQFPIGEVFTEAQTLEAVNGRAAIFAFGDTSFSVNRAEKPIILLIEKGRVVGVEHSTPEFDLVLANIRADEGEVWVRELGFGLNRAFTRDKCVTDIGTYERLCGIHLSLGAKHSMYRKPQFTRSTARHHVDVFVATSAVWLGEEQVYHNGGWVCGQRMRNYT